MNSHIFLIHTSFQAYIAELVANLLKSRNPLDDYHFIFEKIKAEKTLTDFIEEHQIEGIGPSSFGAKKENIYQTLKGNILKKCKGKEKCKVYISDIQWPLNNRLFFDLRSEENIEFNMFIDGTLAYYNPLKKTQGVLRDTAKSFASFLGLGLKYTPYFGSVMGWEREEIKKIYGFSLELSPIDKEKQENINPSAKYTSKIELNKESTIFLDQPYFNNMTKRDSISLIDDTKKYLSKLTNNPIHYKPHHFTQTEYQKLFEDSKLCKISESECIEKIIHKYKFGTVISYNSTALFTLKTIYRDKINCIALDDTKNRIQISKESKAKIFRLFKKSNVKIQEI